MLKEGDSLSVLVSLRKCQRGVCVNVRYVLCVLAK